MQPFGSRLSIIILLFLFTAILVSASPTSGSGPMQEGYPPPAGEIIETPVMEDIPLQSSPVAYPPAGSGIDGATPVPIGSQTIQGTTNGNTAEGNQSSQQDPGRGLLFVWLGFFATLLVFLTSVIGSIVLFTRRNES